MSSSAATTLVFIVLSQAPFEFRGLKWGTTRDVALERIPGLLPRELAGAKKGLETLQGPDTVDDTPAELALTFEADRLVMVSLSLTPPSDRLRLLADFKRKLSLLERKYGAPTDRLDSCMSKDMTVSKANCLTEPKVLLAANWDRPNTRIALLLDIGADGQTFYRILYADLAAAKKRQELRDKAATESL